MPQIKMEQFGGMLPAWDATLLPAGQAADATNGYVFSGALTGWRKPTLLRQLTNSAAKFAYRIPVVVKGIASNTLTFLSNPNDGDTVTLGEITYTFKTVVGASYTVLIGAAPENTAQALLDAATLDRGLNTGQGIYYGNGTSSNDSIDADDSVISGASLVFYAPDSGDAYNTTTTTESTAGARMVWGSGTTMSGGANETFDPVITSAATWMEFDDVDTTVVRSPIVDDQYNRYYHASPTLPPKYNTYDRIANGQPSWLLGVPPPGCAPIVTVAGGGSTATLGFETATSTGTYLPGANTIILTKVTPNGSMLLNDISIMPETTSATAQIAGVLYSDTNGAPDLFLDVGSIVVGCTAGTEVTSTFLNNGGLNRNQTYWIGVMVDENISFQLANDLGNTNGRQMPATFANGPPPTFNFTANIADINMWATLTTSNVVEARAYVYTWLTAYGEESAPSPGTLVNGWSNGTWNVTLWSPSQLDMGTERNIDRIRVYRTVPDGSGQTVFFWVCDIDIATNTIKDVTHFQGVLNGTAIITGPGQINDTLGDDQVALNTVLPSTNWFPPPEGLQGIYMLPNGMLVGFKGNEIWFSEPYYPHAWPPAYVITTEFPIIGLGITGISVVAATGGRPYIATGVNPTAMSLVKLPNEEPCIARGSIISTSSGVYYCSQKGLIEVNPAGAAVNTTELWITRERWAELVPQKFIQAVLQSSCYFAFGSVSGSDTSEARRGFVIELNNGDAQSFTIWPQPGGHRVGFNKLTFESDVVNMYNDPWTGITTMIYDDGVYYYDFTDEAPEISVFDWTSKEYQQNNKESYSAMRVFFRVPPSTPPQNATRLEADTDDAQWDTLPTDRYGYLYVYANNGGDDILVTTRELRTSGELLRINGGQKYEFWTFRVQGRVEISNWQAATSVKELRGV